MKHTYMQSFSALGGIALFGFLGMVTQAPGNPQAILKLTPEEKEILGHMSIVYLDDGFGNMVNKTIRIEGVNVQIVNGTGTTEGSSNGLGNLIVGYNELGNPNGDNRTGSHNYVGGVRNTYSSHGGLVCGDMNTISGPMAAVTGGVRNTASGPVSAVCAGDSNDACGDRTWVGGGIWNTASGGGSTVCGGILNLASGGQTWIGGGESNQATGERSSVAGGRLNVAIGFGSSISGGLNRTSPIAAVNTDYDWIGGSLWEDN